MGSHQLSASHQPPLSGWELSVERIQVSVERFFPGRLQRIIAGAPITIRLQAAVFTPTQPTHSKNMAVCTQNNRPPSCATRLARSVPCRERGARLNNTGLLNSDTRAVLLSDCMQMRSAQITESFVRRFRSTFPGESCCLVSLFITRRSCRALLCLFSLAVKKEGRTPLKRHSTGLPSVSFVRRFRSTIPGESCCLVSLFITRR